MSSEAETKRDDFFSPEGLQEGKFFLQVYSFEIHAEKKELPINLADDTRFVGITSIVLYRGKNHFPVNINGTPFDTFKRCFSSLSPVEKGMPTYRIPYRDTLNVTVDTTCIQSDGETEQDYIKRSKKHYETMKDVSKAVIPGDTVVVTGNRVYCLVIEEGRAQWISMYDHKGAELWPMPAFMEQGRVRLCNKR